MSCPSHEQLYGFLEERLDEALRDSIEKHAENCSACQQRLAQLSEANLPVPARERPEYAPEEAFVRRLKQARPETSANLWGGSTPSGELASPAGPPTVHDYEIPKQVSLSRLATLKMILAEADARYATAGDLADDLRRIVDGRPIAARPIGRRGRLRRWARRNPVTAALTTAVLALLLGIAVGSAVTAVYLQAKLTESEGNQRRAEDADRDAQDKKEPQ
jgi:hypothetical protein